MMRHLFSVFAVTTLLSQGLSLHAEETLPVDIYNFLRVEYDDNVFTTGEAAAVDEVDSLVLIEQIEFLLDSQQGNTYYGLRYSPSFLYYEDRPSDDTDINHQWDLILDHDFSRKTNFQLKHTLRRGEEPELVDEDVTFRNNNDYLFNAVNANISTQVVPDKTSVKARGQFSDFSYDEDVVADQNDYQTVGGGVDVVQVLAPDTNLTGGITYSETEYENSFRDGELIRLAVSYFKVFNPKFQGTVSGGWEQQNTDDPIADDLDSPYADLSLVLLPAESTQVTIGAGYGIDKSPVNTFSAQERAKIFGRVVHDLSAALTLNLNASLGSGSFDTDSATSLYDPAVHTDGDETTLSTLAALMYELNARNSLELSWRYTELESDVRPGSDYDRNRYYLGWKYRL